MGDECVLKDGLTEMFACYEGGTTVDIVPSSMVDSLARNWWAVLLRGIVAVIFGVLALWHPLAVGIALVLLFGVYALIDGVFAIVGAVRAAEAHARWWPFVIEGIVGIGIAAITFFDPGITAVALYWLIAAWAIITGIFEILAAVQLRRVIVNEILLVVSGVISIAFGILLYVFPLVGVFTVLWLIGIYAIIFGVLFIALAFRLHKHLTPSSS
jgi:uncharacterized membrane protein HdeD (DUF308 family)